MDGQVSVFDLLPDPARLVDPVALPPGTAVWIEDPDGLWRDDFGPVFPAVLLEVSRGSPLADDVCMVFEGPPLGGAYGGRNITYTRLARFLGAAWRVWGSEPTEDERRTAKWNSLTSLD